MREDAIAALLRQVYERLYAAYGPQDWWPGDGPIETIVGAILTQNTAWANAKRALERLKQAGALSPAALRALPEAELAELVRSSGSFNVKARKLKAVAEWLAVYGDDPARLAQRGAKALRHEALGVYGVGPETADVIVLYAAGLPSFVIDAYTIRVLERLGVEPESRSYEGYQALFEERLPPDAALFNEFHALLDVHAATICGKRAPRCGECPLRDVCAYGGAAR
ncbi:MAG: endonuclease [Chloroflexota bacterium]|nr:endonuclease [Chloroflexota bacterium]